MRKKKSYTSLLLIVVLLCSLPQHAFAMQALVKTIFNVLEFNPRLKTALDSLT